jgi:hypothetical protein
MDTLCKKILWLALMLVISPSGNAQEKVSKKISKTYALTDAGELQLENKYGHININGWDQDEVSIAIIVTVNHRKKETAQDLLKRINPKFMANDEFVSVDYEVAEKSDHWFGSLFEKANPFDHDRSNIQIDYEVFLPRKSELTLNNTFGDVIIEDWFGTLNATLEHGDLFINENLTKANINMRYGKVRAQNISYASVDLKNGSLDITDAQTLRLNSSGSDVDLNAITSLEIYSNKDEITLLEVGTMYGNLKFTTLQIDRLLTSVDMTFKIADFSVDNIVGSDADIAIEQESSEVSLNVSGYPHDFSATLEEGLVRLPKSYKNVKSNVLDKGKRMREINATYGKNVKGNIKINGQKGVILIKEIDPSTVRR